MKDIRWRETQVVVLGAARQGAALAEFLSQKGARVIITDLKSKDELQDTRQRLEGLQVEWVLGEHPLSLLEDTDVLAVSGGVPLTLPLVEEARQRGIPLTNDSQIFMEQVPCPVIGITGSAGKTTTTSLVGRMVEEDRGPDRTWMGGNIGNPLLARVEDMSAEDLAVVELSSFQLELMVDVPQVAGVLNLTPNHLDRHGTMEAYVGAKARIITHQGPGGTVILNRDDPGSWKLLPLVQGELISFGKDRPLRGRRGVYLDGDQVHLFDGEESRSIFSTALIALRGEHNLSNILAACALAWAAGISPRSMAAGVQGFTGVEHRLERIRERNGVLWINDSIATAPERALAAMRSFSEPLILLAGGRDKDLPWEEFSRYVLDHVRHLILFGEAADLIEESLHGVDSNPEERLEITRTPGLASAVDAAAEAARPGDVVLLAPGGTSFDEFVDFAARGDFFKQKVKSLP